MSRLQRTESNHGLEPRWQMTRFRYLELRAKERATGVPVTWDEETQALAEEHITWFNRVEATRHKQQWFETELDLVPLDERRVPSIKKWIADHERELALRSNSESDDEEFLRQWKLLLYPPDRTGMVHVRVPLYWARVHDPDLPTDPGIWVVRGSRDHLEMEEVNAKDEAQYAERMRRMQARARAETEKGGEGSSELGAKRKW